MNVHSYSYRISYEWKSVQVYSECKATIYDKLLIGNLQSIYNYPVKIFVSYSRNDADFAQVYQFGVYNDTEDVGLSLQEHI